ncbi:MAG: hypothetical protein NT023_15890 [Armatimonadetes bacterium]|nr:hypothetical protein [Armatimonadota bacterium]
MIWLRRVTSLSIQIELSDLKQISTRANLEAIPVELGKATSPWLTAPPATLSGITKVIGKSDYVAHVGISSGGLNGVYWVRILLTLPNGNLLIENMGDVGKKKVDSIQIAIEPDFVYPLLRGRDIRSWRAEPSCNIVAPQDIENQREGIPASRMKRKYPKTYSFFYSFEQELLKRPDRKYYPVDAPFYTIRNMADYSLSTYKVVWKDMGSFIQAAVVSKHNQRTVCPEHHVMAVSLEDEDEAHYLCAALMSAPRLLHHQYGYKRPCSSKRRYSALQSLK